MFKLLHSHSAFCAINCETYFFLNNRLTYLPDFAPYGGPTLDELKDLYAKSRNLIEFYDLIATLICTREGAQYFLEKSPLHTPFIRYLRFYFPRAKFINMIRDGRDGYISSLRLAGNPHRFTLDEYIEIWRRAIRARRQMGNDKHILDVYYEEFTRKPYETMQTVMDFLGEPLQPQQLHPEQLVDDARYESDNAGTRGHERLNKPIQPSTVNQWRTEMSYEQVRIFQQLAGKELRACGYVVDEP